MRNKKTPQSGLLVSYDVNKPQTLHKKLPKPQEQVDLPQEVLRIICSYVDADELPNLRLVSIAFSNAAAVHMFRTMDFGFTASSFECILNVARSTKLQHHVLKLGYNAKWMSTWPISWEPECLEYHFSHQRELKEALKKLVNLNAIEFRPLHQDPQNTLENRRVTYRRIFDPFWKFLTSSLSHVSNLRSIIAANSFPYEGESLEELSTEEIKALGRLQNLTLGLDTHFGRRLPNLLCYMSNLRSLELRELVDLGERDFSELVSPSTKFRSLVSLKLDGFNLNERYFKHFLLENAHSLRSLSLRNLKLEITEKEFDTEDYYKCNQWIRMFFFFSQSMRLKNIELHGQLRTSLSGTWFIQDFVEGDKLYAEPNLMLQLTNFITHTEGSSFPLPHPDEDLRNIDFRGYGVTRGLFWVKILKRKGSIRLLRKKPHKPSVFNGYLHWEQPGFGNLAVQNDVELDGSLYNQEEHAADPEDEVVVEIEDIAAQASAFERAKAYFLANRESWTDEEKVAMAFLVDADPMSFDVESPAPFNSPTNLNLF
ncbi:e01c059b-9dda-4b1c-94e0-4b91e938c82f-CDS [Sclerotinia trifoliorum]|uniref:E01c059b-9dda-4b1c-94e0-4b91e938c82f-CDS n=1 Tax=Sclerotinia trifoliorum TaxID=28548 RepID=A0A8H2ZSI7_9HELO|nr:e01c059b-9dda-4b1c-94e0-4b91e938c82f-CDS [Sclerotinia trifoliorum]